MHKNTYTKMKIKDCILIGAFKCSEDESVVDVAKKLRNINLRHIFVVDKNDFPVGIISVIDINNRVVALGKDPKELKAKDIMSKPIEVYDLQDEIEEVCKKMVEKIRVMCAVTKEKKMIGIITIHQLLKKLEK
jgi:CBS domain-containing protein